jgi:hypothetical protein
MLKHAATCTCEPPDIDKPLLLHLRGVGDKARNSFTVKNLLIGALKHAFEQQSRPAFGRPISELPHHMECPSGPTSGPDHFGKTCPSPGGGIRILDAKVWVLLPDIAWRPTRSRGGRGGCPHSGSAANWSPNPRCGLTRTAPPRITPATAQSPAVGRLVRAWSTR